MYVDYITELVAERAFYRSSAVSETSSGTSPSRLSSSRHAISLLAMIMASSVLDVPYTLAISLMEYRGRTVPGFPNVERAVQRVPG
jgi:hypothetical protein